MWLVATVLNRLALACKIHAVRTLLYPYPIYKCNTTAWNSACQLARSQLILVTGIQKINHYVSNLKTGNSIQLNRFGDEKQLVSKFVINTVTF